MGKYRKAIPSAQYSPAVLPPAMIEANLAMSSAVWNKSRSIIMISWKGSNLTFTSLPSIVTHLLLLFLVKVAF